MPSVVLVTPINDPGAPDDTPEAFANFVKIDLQAIVAAIDGIEGTLWHTGTGVPGAGLGTNGDFYLDDATGDVYGPKTAGAWGAVVATIIGPQGATGATGATGQAGADLGIPLAYEATTGDTDQGNGKFWFNNADPALATEFYISDTDADGTDSGARVATWNQGRVEIRSPVTRAKWIDFIVASSVTPQTGYRKMTISDVTKGTAPVDADAMSVFHAPKGVDGGGAGDMQASVYDPGTIAGDAFNMVNMLEGADSNILTDAERTAIAAAVSGTLVNVQAFVSSGTYVPHADATKALYFVTGGGGGGADCAADDSSGAGGGGAGGTAIEMITISGNETVTIGAGGAGGSGGPGSAGGASSFGAHGTGNGGGGGATGSGSTGGTGGDRGSSSGGTFNPWGGDGSPGGGAQSSTAGGNGGLGGSSFWGGGGGGGRTHISSMANGSSGEAYGSGGGGGNGHIASTGGTGKGGCCLVLEFA